MTFGIIDCPRINFMRLILIIIIPTLLMSGCKLLQKWEVSETIYSEESYCDDENVISPINYYTYTEAQHELIDKKPESKIKIVL